MKRIHFDSKRPVKWHYFFWQPWGCAGCLLRFLGFMLLLALFLFLLSQFRSCSDGNAADASGQPVASQPVGGVVPPINEDDVVDDGGRRLVGNRLNVLFGAETGQAEYEAWVERFKELYPSDEYQVLFYDSNTKLMSIQVEESRRTELITLLPEQIPDIPFMVFEEEVMEMGMRPNDPVFSHSDHAYYFDQIKAFDAWDYTTGKNQITIAVVDSYFDLDNVEFQNTAIVHPYSVVTGDTIVGLPGDYDPRRPNPVYMHGSMVAGMALGASGNGRASAGMAPRCSFMPVSLGDRFGCLAMLQGILYAINHEATVINISAGLSFTEEVSSWPVEAQIETARTELLAQEAVWKYVFDMANRNYVTIVWAAGNENVFTALDASKRGDVTIKVSAVDASMSKAMFSNFGNFPEENIYESTVSAPGVQVPGIVPGTTGYTLTDGTSFSAPIVSGCVGLIKSLDPTLSTVQIIELLKSTGKPVAGGETSIGPIVQIGPAIERLYTEFVEYDALLQAVSSGTSQRAFPWADLRRLVVEDSTALAPLLTIDMLPTGPNRGKLRFYSNREEGIAAEAEYTARCSADSIVITQQVANSPAGEAVFGTATYTVKSNSRAKAEVAGVLGQWWLNFEPFLIKNPV